MGPPGIPGTGVNPSKLGYYVLQLSNPLTRSRKHFLNLKNLRFRRSHGFRKTNSHPGAQGRASGHGARREGAPGGRGQLGCLPSA